MNSLKDLIFNPPGRVNQVKGEMQNWKPEQLAEYIRTYESGQQYNALFRVVWQIVDVCRGKAITSEECQAAYNELESRGLVYDSRLGTSYSRPKDTEERAA